MDDTEINALVKRLSRPHPSGGIVIERAAILAAGADSSAVIDWIVDHHGMGEAPAAPARSRGLHGTRLTDGDAAPIRKALRFVLPPGAVSDAPAVPKL